MNGRRIRSGHIQRKNSFIFVVQKRLRAFLNHKKGLRRFHAVYGCDLSCEKREPESLRTFRLFLCLEGLPSQALPRQLSQRESRAVKPIAKALGVMRKFPATLLALPLGELANP